MSFWYESRSTLKLATPLIIGQVSQMLLGVADTVMLGRLGVTELAVLTFTNSLFYLPFIFAIGVLTAVSVFTSNARGAQDYDTGKASCLQGFQISIVLGVGLSGLFCAFTPLLGFFGQPPEVVARSTVFYLVIMLSMIPAITSASLKNHADAMDCPWPAFWIYLAGVLFNIFLNWLLIYGNWGCPRLELEGAAWATLISRFLILGAMFFWLSRSSVMKDWVPVQWFRRIERTAIKRFLAIGIPASLQIVCEVGAFSAAGLLMGRFGEVAMAAHQIALMCAATAFMVPLGLSMALSVRIGEVAGKEQLERLRPITLSGWALGSGWALVSAGVFLCGGEMLGRLFTQEPLVIVLTGQIFLVVGIFQLVDTLQVGSSAILRGLHDTKVSALYAFISYWVLGIPLSVVLSTVFHLGAVGVWWGLASGLAFACVALCARTWMKTAPA